LKKSHLQGNCGSGVSAEGLSLVAAGTSEATSGPGVRDNAEGITKNLAGDLYNKEQIRKALREANLSWIEKILFENLEKN